MNVRMSLIVRQDFAFVLTDFVKFDIQDRPLMLLILVTTSAMTATRGHTCVKDVCHAAYTLHHIWL